MPKTRSKVAREVDKILRSGSGKVTPSTDPDLWTTRPVFGVAGGPIEVLLTNEGDSRAFSVGAQVRRGGPAEALEALWIAGGEGHLTLRDDGARLKRTELGRFNQIAWGHLKTLGLVVSFQDHLGEGVRLTDAGRRAAQGGNEERARLLARCRSAFAREATPLKRTPHAQLEQEIAAVVGTAAQKGKRKAKTSAARSKRQLLLWIPFATKGSASIARPVPVDFTAKEVESVWTLTSSRNPSITPVLPLHPVHGRGAFLEDYMHDWTVRDGSFVYRSRITDQPTWVLVQLK